MNSSLIRKGLAQPCTERRSETVLKARRRDFLRQAGVLAGSSVMTAAVPGRVLKALAAQPERATGTIEDVEHIVILTQENRSFDHYFGSLRGVRGFNDRSAISLPNGDPVWKQPTNDGYILPFHIDTARTSAACIGAPMMSYPIDIAMWHDGLCDQWNNSRAPGLGMSFYTREDLPFYYALADAFTICDQYFASSFTQTNPNRLHLFSGSSGLSVGVEPTLDNLDTGGGFRWPTLAETLEAAGISWRVYQQADNFDDNPLAFFKSFKSAPPSSPLYRKGMARVDNIVDAFRADVIAGTLPKVSWIVAPSALSEHANHHPQAGEHLTAQLLSALVSNPAIYSGTVFLLNYDEQGGFFDHEPPPTPPANDRLGKSTVSTDGEVYEGLPIGLGFRVPMTIVSPWSRGGFVCSQVFDHTSIIQFIERRFGVRCPNISAWRRAICGDLTSAFDFKVRVIDWPQLPDTSSYAAEATRQCKTLPPPAVPTIQAMPRQEAGTRRSRALPYHFDIQSQINPIERALSVRMTNRGDAGVALTAYNLKKREAPRRYALASHSEILDHWSETRYHVVLRGPNGFLRVYRGDIGTHAKQTPHAEVSLNPGNRANAILLTLTNSGPAPCVFKVNANAYQTGHTSLYPVPAREKLEIPWDLTKSGNWYDLTVTVDYDSLFLRRFAGRLENGLPLTSDPAAA